MSASPWYPYGGVNFTLVRARKAELCDWCGKSIRTDSRFYRRTYSDGTMLRMHQQCIKVANDPSLNDIKVGES